MVCAPTLFRVRLCLFPSSNHLRTSPSSFSVFEILKLKQLNVLCIRGNGGGGRAVGLGGENSVKVNAGDRITILTPGGGGYDKPDPATVAMDIEVGVVGEGAEHPDRKSRREAEIEALGQRLRAPPWPGAGLAWLEWCVFRGYSRVQSSFGSGGGGSHFYFASSSRVIFCPSGVD